MDKVIEELGKFLTVYGKVHLVGLSLGGVITLVSGTVFSFRSKSAKLINKYAAPIYGMLKPD
jgi:esterase/lipase